MKQGQRWNWDSVMRSLVVSGALLLPAPGGATEVQVVGVTPGRTAAVVIDGGQPFKIGVGETVESVKVVSVDRDGAVLVVNGVTQTVPLGAQTGSGSGGRKSGSGNSVTLTAGPDGHFITSGTINGRSIRFLVDTGATRIALSRSDADRLNIRYRDGEPMRFQTANGSARGWGVMLNSVTIGNLTLRNVDAAVQEGFNQPFALLGMSFLKQVDMQRQGSTMVLRRR